MANSTSKLKAALKLKTTSREGALSLRLGTKKYTLPFEVRLVQGENFVFVHIPPAAEIMKLTSDGLNVVTSDEEATQANEEFKRSRRKKRGGSGGRASAEVPDELKQALAKIPSGFRLVTDASGEARLVKTRKRRKR